MTRLNAALLLSAALALAGCDVTGGNRRWAPAAWPAPSARAVRLGQWPRRAGGRGGGDRCGDGRPARGQDRRAARRRGPPAGLCRPSSRRWSDGASGAPVPWRNPASGRYGNIVPGPAYAAQGVDLPRLFPHRLHRRAARDRPRHRLPRLRRPLERGDQLIGNSASAGRSRRDRAAFLRPRRIPVVVSCPQHLLNAGAAMKRVTPSGRRSSCNRADRRAEQACEIEL